MNASILQFSLAENLLDMLANTTARRDAPHALLGEVDWNLCLGKGGWDGESLSLGWRVQGLCNLRAAEGELTAADAEDARRRDAACSRGAFLLGCSTYVPSSPLKTRGRSQWLVQEKGKFPMAKKSWLCAPYGRWWMLVTLNVVAFFYFLFSISLKKKKSNSLLLCSLMPQHFAVTLCSVHL